jgi:hypothetical protein
LSRKKKEIPISRCIKRSWKFQDFKTTGHPYWELWNEILHAIAPIVEKNKLERDKKAKDIKVFGIFPYADTSITQNTKTNNFNYASPQQTL